MEEGDRVDRCFLTHMRLCIKFPRSCLDEPTIFHIFSYLYISNQHVILKILEL
jgi:hypothetical protein